MKKKNLLSIVIAILLITFMLGACSTLFKDNDSSAQTTSPSGSAGNELKHEHTFDITRVEATCTEPGTETKTCRKCGYEEVTEIPASHSIVVVSEALAATCENAGNTEGRACEKCEYVIPSEVLPAFGHDLITHEDKAASCYEAGYADYVTCSRCEYSSRTELPIIDHNYIDGTCNMCGSSGPKEITDLTNTTWHIPSGWSAEAGYGEFEIFAVYNNIQNVESLRIGWGIDMPPPFFEYVMVEWENRIIIDDNDLFPTMSTFKLTITGGKDVTNPDLIAWLLSNGTLVEDDSVVYTLSGVWEFNEVLVKQYPWRVSQVIDFQSYATGNKGEFIDTEFVEMNFNTNYLSYSAPPLSYTVYIFGRQWDLDLPHYPQCKTVDFGSTPQVVSKEFYEEFTANAVQI